MSYANVKKLYHRRRTRAAMGASGPSDCGAGQMWYPNLTYAGVTGQCSDPLSAQSALNSGVATGNLNSGTPTQGGGGGSNDNSVGSNIGAALKSLFGGGSSSQIPTLPYALPSSGPDMTTVLLIGGVAALGIYLVTRK